MSAPRDLTLAPAFIETQFPVSKLSKESYKERKANYSQTLTGLGKWWGRKPLVLVRAAILGLLLPATDDPQRDRKVFLKLMTMDGDGLRRRKSKNIPLRDAYALLTDAQRAEWFVRDANPERPKFKKGMSNLGRAAVQVLAFSRLTTTKNSNGATAPSTSTALPNKHGWKSIRISALMRGRCPNSCANSANAASATRRESAMRFAAAAACLSKLHVLAAMPTAPT